MTRIQFPTRAAETAAIKRGLREAGITVEKVSQGRGTAYGWVDVHVALDCTDMPAHQSDPHGPGCLLDCVRCDARKALDAMTTLVVCRVTGRRNKADSMSDSWSGDNVSVYIGEREAAKVETPAPVVETMPEPVQAPIVDNVIDFASRKAEIEARRAAPVPEVITFDEVASALLHVNCRCTLPDAPRTLTLADVQAAIDAAFEWDTRGGDLYTRGGDHSGWVRIGTLPKEFSI